MRTSLRLARIIISIGLVFVLGHRSASAGSKKPPAPTIDLTVECTADCNRCGASPAPLNFKVLQLRDASSFTDTSDVNFFWNKEQARLGTSLLEMESDHVEAGTSRARVVNFKDGAGALLVVGRFCNAKAKWYFVWPRVRKTTGIALKIDSRGFGDPVFSSKKRKK